MLKQRKYSFLFSPSTKKIDMYSLNDKCTNNLGFYSLFNPGGKSTYAFLYELIKDIMESKYIFFDFHTTILYNIIQKLVTVKHKMIFLNNITNLQRFLHEKNVTFTLPGKNSPCN